MIIARALRRQITVTVILAVAAQGCGGVTGPPALSRSERATLEAARFDIKVGVQGHRRVKGDEDAWSRDLFIAAMLVPTIGTDTQRWEVTFTAPDTKPVVHVAVEHDGTVMIGLVGFLATVDSRMDVGSHPARPDLRSPRPRYRQEVRCAPSARWALSNDVAEASTTGNRPARRDPLPRTGQP